MSIANLISYEDFARVDIRSGTIVKIEEFPRARKPAYKVWADFGEAYGVKQTSAQVTVHYTPEQLIGRQIVGVMNLGEKNIAGLCLSFYSWAFRTRVAQSAYSPLTQRCQTDKSSFKDDGERKPNERLIYY